MDITACITEYIEDKKLAWSPSTLKSEEYRLKGLAEAITGTPHALWTALEAYKPYSRVTAWTRVTQFWDWCIEVGKVPDGRNPYQAFRKKHARLFKNAYQERVPDVSFEDARARIASITDTAIRVQAERILSSGMRYFESLADENGQVVGKGGKVREVFLPERDRDLEFRSYASFRRALAGVGLKPHDLRKIFAGKVVDEGADVFVLKDLMGWVKLETASKYLNGRKSLKREIALKILSSGISELPKG